MSPLGPFDREEWTERHPAPAVWAVRKRHGVSIARRIVQAGALALCCAGLIAVAIATVEIAADWVRAS